MKPAIAVDHANAPQDPDDLGYDSDIEIVDPRNGNWSIETHLVYPAPGAKMALGPQTIQVQRVARAAIQGLVRSMYFEDAFPDVCLRTKFNRDALYNAANELNFHTLAQRIQSDLEYVDALAGLVRAVHTSSPPFFMRFLPNYRQILAWVSLDWRSRRLLRTASQDISDSIPKPPPTRSMH